MSKSRYAFKQTDIRRAMRAVKAEGVDILEVVVDANGAIRIIVSKLLPSGERSNEWDVVYDENAPKIRTRIS